MATVSVKDTWFTDPRRGRLIRRMKCEPRLVDGIMLECWRIGQEFAAKGTDLPSLQIFDRSEIEAIASVGLAIIQENGVYILGSKEAAAYRIQHKAAGKVGGIASGKSRRNKINTLDEANRSKTEQNEPSSSSSSSSSSFLDSSFTPPSIKRPRPRDPMGDRLRVGGVGISDEALKKALHDVYPNRDGWLTALVYIKHILALDPDRLADMELAVANYRERMKEAKREPGKMKTIANFFAEGLWESYVNPAPNDDFSESGDDSHNWLAEAHKVFAAIRAHGTERASANLPEDLVRLVRKSGGFFGLGRMKQDDYSVKNLAGMLKAAAEGEHEQDPVP